MSKPEMPEEKYHDFAMTIAAMQKWADAGYFSKEENIANKYVLGNVINTWSYDFNKLKTITEGMNIGITEQTCNRIAEDTQVTKLRWEQARQVQSQPTPILINPPRTTTCNRVGTQMLCNSFWLKGL